MPKVTVAIPTLRGGVLLSNCLSALSRQTFTDFDVFVLDNSCSRKAVYQPAPFQMHIIEMPANVGFGAAVNHAIRLSSSSFVATLNDDTEAHSRWLEALTDAADRYPAIGMFAPQIRLFGSQELDSAGMLIAVDGSAKQRGHHSSPSHFREAEEILFPSGCAALYRRAMLDDVGLFDEKFFLYCEDTDLGLRAQWRGWRGRYVPDAVVEHHYSASAGPASELKARCVEANRLRVVIRNFPARYAWKSFGWSIYRYYLHFRRMRDRRGLAAASGLTPIRAISIIISAHFSLLRGLPELVRQRMLIQRSKRIPIAAFGSLLRRHSISLSRLADET